MPAPTNISFATATDLGAVPATIAQQVDDGATVYTVYYSIVPAATGFMGFWASGDLVNYKPSVAIYESDQTTIYLSINGAENKPVQFPVTSGAKLYFKLSPQALPGLPANLAISTLAAPVLTPRTGSIFINDDNDGFPLACLDGTNGTVQKFFTFPAGEQAEVLTDGTILSSDDFNSQTILYSSQLVSQATLALDCRAMGSDGVSTFYVQTFGSNLVTAVSALGVAGSTWTVTIPSGAVKALAPSPDNTILYYSNGDKVQAWDLVNNIALTDLAAAVAGYKTLKNMIALSDGTIIVGYAQSASTGYFIRAYSPAGTILHTYTLTSSRTVDNRVARAIDDPNSFWTWIKETGGVSRFENVKVSDGSILATFDAIQYEGGVYQGAETASPSARFGHSESCPFIIFRADIGPPTTTTTYPIRRLRQTAHLSTEQLWLFFSKLQLDCEAGVGLNDGQGSDPQVMLSWSDDGGHTWSAEQWMSAGKIGEYKRRVIWRRLGRSRDRVWRIVVSDPVAWRLLAAYIDVKKGTS